MIKAENILSEIKKRFPDFFIEKDIEDLPTVVFSFLSNYLIDSIRQDEKETQQRFILFFNELVASNDPIVNACIDEIILGLYTGYKENYWNFVNKLSQQAARRFFQTIDLWDSGKGSVQQIIR